MAQSRKERQRLKRKKKQQALRKQHNLSDYAKAARGAIVECCMNSDWAERGQAVAFILRKMSDGRLAMASFMIDLWCAGLKDIWVHVDLARQKFHENIDHQNRLMDGAIGPAPLETVAAVVAGSIRFAVQNGFRLPNRYERATAFCGPTDWKTADLGKFGVEGGKLRWVGPLFDLRRRLISMSAEEFMKRPDVEFLAGLGEPEHWNDFRGEEFGEYGEGEYDDGEDEEEEEGDGEDEESDLTLAEVARKSIRDSTAALVELTRRWCFKNGLIPDEKIPQAAEQFFSTVYQLAIMPDSDLPDSTQGTDAKELATARDQIERCMKSYPTAEEFQEAIEVFRPAPGDDEIET